mgnify:CR=1 FL=1
MNRSLLLFATDPVFAAADASAVAQARRALDEGIPQVAIQTLQAALKAPSFPASERPAARRLLAVLGCLVLSPALLSAAEPPPPWTHGKHQPISGRVFVTPEMASEWLEANRVNRRVRSRAVDRITRDIKRGRWIYNGQSIVFSKTWRLLDGQHRLMAIVAAGVAVEAAVATGVEDAAMDRIDTNGAGGRGHATAYCAARGIDHVTLRWEGAKPAANLQAADLTHARHGYTRGLLDCLLQNTPPWAWPVVALCVAIMILFRPLYHWIKKKLGG